MNKVITKSGVIIVLLNLFCNYVLSQDIIATFKDFYQNADKDCYVDLIQKEINERIRVNDSIFLADPVYDHLPTIPPKLSENNIVFILKVQFVGTGSYQYEDDIYNYLQIDSTRMFVLACVDKKQNLKALTDYGPLIYYQIDKKSEGKTNWHWNICAISSNYIHERKANRDLKNVIKKINKQQPDLILQCDALKGFLDDNSFMYIKGNKIFVFRVDNRKIFELNDYIRNYFSLERIREDLSWMWVPSVYPNKNILDRPTGKSSKSEYRLCPPPLSGISPFDKNR